MSRRKQTVVNPAILDEVAMSSDPEDLSPPDWLSPGALAEWERVTGELCAKSILQNVDKAILTMYVVTYDKWTTIEAMLSKVNPGSPDGLLLWTELNGQSEKLLKELRGIASDLRFTPRSRKVSAKGHTAKTKKIAGFRKFCLDGDDESSGQPQ